MPDTQFTAKLPVFDAATITPEQFCDAMQVHSVVHLRHAVPPLWVERLRDAVVRTYAEFHDYLDKAERGEDLTMTGLTLPQIYTEQRKTIEFFRSYASILLANAPYGAETICQAMGENRVMDLLTAWFKTRPMLALNASSVRKQELDGPTRCIWHQDGQFLGGVDAETINTWIALDDCGLDAPGVEVIPERLTEILPCGKPGSELPWEIFDADVEERFAGKIWRPVFQAGDILAFDAANLHRTFLTKDMVRERHACECWWYTPKNKHENKLLAFV